MLTALNVAAGTLRKSRKSRTTSERYAFKWRVSQENSLFKISHDPSWHEKQRKDLQLISLQN